MLLTIFRVTGWWLCAPRLKHSRQGRLITPKLLPPTSWIFSLLDDYRLRSRRCLVYCTTRLCFVFVFSTQPRGSPCSQPEIIELVRTLEMLPNSSDFFSFGLTVQVLPWAPPPRGHSRYLTVGTTLQLQSEPARRLLVGQKENSSPRKTQRASSCTQAVIPVQNDISRAKAISVYLYSGSNSSTERYFPRESHKRLLVLGLYIQYHSM